MLKKTTYIIFIAIFILSLSACKGKTVNESSLASFSSLPPTETSAAEPSEETTSAGPISSLPESESSEPESVPSDLDSESSNESENSDLTNTFISPITVGSEDFKTMFHKNEIDKLYLDRYMNAPSTSMFLEAVRLAAEDWNSAIDKAYGEAMESCSDDAQREEVKQSQIEFASTLDAKMEDIHKAEGDEFAAGEKILLLYRERAAELLFTVYENTGSFELPVPTEL